MDGSQEVRPRRRFEHLLSPVRIGHLELRNRVFQPAHSKGTSHDGLPTRQDLAYKVERAQGGTALMITGSRMVHPSSATRGAVAAYRREAIPLNRELVARVEEEGSRVFVQLGHFGGARGGGYYNAAWSPSGIPPSRSVPVPKAMDADDLRGLVEYWVRSAAYSVEGGFPGLELHFAHGYLVGQYVSPRTNTRDDEYGGGPAERAALALAIVAAVREEVGSDIVVGARIGVTEETGSGGLTQAEGIEYARLLADTGKLDYLNISASGPRKDSWIAPPVVDDGYLVAAAAAVRAAIGDDVAVLAAGGVRRAIDADAAIADGQAEMIGMTRALIADPDYVAKVEAGEEGLVYRCIRGNQGCIRRLNQGLAVRCTVNPRAGRESLFGRLAPPDAGDGARWIVVGGGPSGLKAAETLALRGKRVVLYEAGDRVGGQVGISRRVRAGGHNFGALVDDLETHLERLSVEVVVGHRATAENVDTEGVEGIVVATGAAPLPARESLVEAGLSAAYLDGVATATGWEVIQGESLPDVADAPVVVDDELGNRCAAGVVATLLEAGADVLLVTRRNGLLHELEGTLDWDLVTPRLIRGGLQYRLNCRLAADDRDGCCLSLRDALTGQPLDHVADVALLVHVALPRPEEGPYFSFRDSGVPTVRAGDCVAPRGLDEAIYEGFLAGTETRLEGQDLEVERLLTT